MRKLPYSSGMTDDGGRFSDLCTMKNPAAELRGMRSLSDSILRPLICHYPAGTVMIGAPSLLPVSVREKIIIRKENNDLDRRSRLLIQNQWS